VTQASLQEETVLRVYCGEEHCGSARVTHNRGGKFRLFAYVHQSPDRQKFYDSVAEWLESFDEDSYKLGVKIGGQRDFVDIV
jgi:hypothetical protein